MHYDLGFDDETCRLEPIAAALTLWRAKTELESLNATALDRHRGGGHPPTPATPPCVRVRTRRFELVKLEPVNQCWKAE